MSESSIAQIDKNEAVDVLCHFLSDILLMKINVLLPIALSEQFQILKEYLAGTSILNFIALETEDIVAYMKICLTTSPQ